MDVDSAVTELGKHYTVSMPRFFSSFDFHLFWLGWSCQAQTIRRSWRHGFCLLERLVLPQFLRYLDYLWLHVYVNGYQIVLEQVKKDDLIPDLLILPPGTDLHDHPLVTSGNVFLQVGILIFIDFYFQYVFQTHQQVSSTKKVKRLAFHFTILQGKASSMVAVALGPRPGWQVS